MIDTAAEPTPSNRRGTSCRAPPTREEPLFRLVKSLTQLGGLAIGDGAGGLLYEWKDPGICAVCNFEDALDALDGKD